MPTKKSQVLKEKVLSRLEQLLGKPTLLGSKPLLLKYGDKRVHLRVLPRAGNKFWFDVTPRLYENHETDFLVYACGNTQDLYVFPVDDFAKFIQKASKGWSCKPNFDLYLRSHEFEPAGQSSHRFKIKQFFRRFDFINSDLKLKEIIEDSNIIEEFTAIKPQSTPIATDIEEPNQPERVKQETYRILRDTVLAREVKEFNKYKCHICGQILRLKDEQSYAEAHHVKPLGSPHDGPDVRENILCVCPNHHVMLDYGAIKLDKQQLTSIAGEYIDYHNENIFTKK
ncbi:MAG: HNH endonuclease [Desulfobaccales bacterium]